MHGTPKNNVLSGETSLNLISSLMNFTSENNGLNDGLGFANPLIVCFVESNK